MKHFLYLTNDKLVTLLWHGGKIVARDVFMAGETNSAPFREYLLKHRAVPTYLVADLIEEDFRLDTTPHLRGADADAVMGRKLAQLYRASNFRHAIVQERTLCRHRRTGYAAVGMRLESRLAAGRQRLCVPGSG